MRSRIGSPTSRASASVRLLEGEMVSGLWLVPGATGGADAVACGAAGGSAIADGLQAMAIAMWRIS